MTQPNNVVSPLRQRMIEDMTLRKLAPRTQQAYIRAVVNLTRFLGRSPDTADAEHISAQCRDGILEVAIPKQPQVQARRIEVQAA